MQVLLCARTCACAHLATRTPAALIPGYRRMHRGPDAQRLLTTEALYAALTAQHCKLCFRQQLSWRRAAMRQPSARATAHRCNDAPAPRSTFASLIRASLPISRSQRQAKSSCASEIHPFQSCAGHCSQCTDCDHPTSHTDALWTSAWYRSKMCSERSMRSSCVRYYQAVCSTS